MGLNIIFDLDETLVDTSQIKVYRKTNEGRVYIAENMGRAPTRVYSPVIKKVLEYCSSKGIASIVSNSPEKYLHALIDKHSFPKEIPVFGSAGKPSLESILSAMNKTHSLKQDTLMIGDEAKDILTAHKAGICSVGVTWGNTSTKKQLEKAEPTRIISNPEALEDIIIEFEKKGMQYEKRKALEDYSFLPNERRNIIYTDKNHKSLGDYCPVSRSEPINGLTREILAFKSSKEHTLEQINDGLTDDYFYGGMIRKGREFREVIHNLREKTYGLIDSFNLKGDTLLMAIPNSFPAYCYKLDVAQRCMNKIEEESGNKYRSMNPRPIERVHPKLKGERGCDVHYDTLGFKSPFNFDNANNIVLFDDVKTTNSQISSMRAILRYLEFKGNICSITLGDTILEENSYNSF